MRAWRIAVVGAALVGVSIVTMGAVAFVHHGSDGRAVIAHASADRNGQPISAVTAPITPAEAASDRTYGWGPYRVVDW